MKTLKKVLLLTVLMTTATNCFAYYEYGSYSTSIVEPPVWLILLGVLMIILGILEIILFFKIWRMTDNVKQIKSYLLNEDHISPKKIRQDLIMGDIENVRKLFLIDFCTNIEPKIKYIQYLVDQSQATKYWKKSISSDKDRLQKMFDKINEKIPDVIQKLNTYEDYYNLFH